MMPLLKNADIRFHPKCTRMVVVCAAIHGPFFKHERDWSMVALYMIYAAAAVFIALDLFVWRAQ